MAEGRGGAARGLRVVSWNVNGLAALEAHAAKTLRGAASPLGALLDSFDAEIVCVQETKLTRSKVTEALAFVDGYDSFFSCCGRAGKGGYSGVATYCRTPHAAPVDAWEGLRAAASEACAREMDAVAGGAAAMRRLDGEGRAVVTDHDAFVLVNAYFPNGHGGGGGGPADRREFKARFHAAAGLLVRDLAARGREVLLAGDINCSHTELDTPSDELKRRVFGSKAGAGADLAQRRASRAATRKWMDGLLEGGGGPLVDTFRALHPERRGAYTCWNTELRCREANVGTRLDYVLASAGLAHHGGRRLAGVIDADVLQHVTGSDHCPVVATFSAAAAPVRDAAGPAPVRPALCSRNMEELSGRQQSLDAFMRSPASSSSSSPCAGTFAAAMQRERDPPPPPKPPAKRQKTAATIKGFFQKKRKVPEEAEGAAAAAAVAEVDGPAKEAPAPRKSKHAAAARPGWMKLLNGKPNVPVCTAHSKPCKMQVARKKGVNCGRKFFSCSLPVDQSCKFFMWESDARRLKSASMRKAE